MPSPLDEPEMPTPTDSPKPPDTIPGEPKNETLAIEYGNDQDQRVDSKTDEKVETLDLGEGNVVKLDGLGPMIINSDGTLSRIQNWHELSPIEQERTVRLLVKKRNLVRLQKLESESTEPKSDSGDERLTALKQS